MDKAKWNIISPVEAGMHEVVNPKMTDCKVVRFYRLNLLKGQNYTLKSGSLEMNAALIKGTAKIKSAYFNEELNKLDSFYIPGQSAVEIEADSDLIFYIGAAECEGFGKPFLRKFQKDLPLGDIHQIHGEGVGEREVFFTLNPEMPASRLICGYTWGGNGTWTSWPPHQHEKYLEELYCYFDMKYPSFGMHLSYDKPGQLDEAEVHIVREGHIVLAPWGYHPTVASPGSRNIYFWILAAFNHDCRRYDLAELDPNYKY